MSPGTRIDRANWSKIQHADGAPGSATKGNCYIDDLTRKLWIKSGDTWVELEVGDLWEVSGSVIRPATQGDIITANAVAGGVSGFAFSEADAAAAATISYNHFTDVLAITASGGSEDITVTAGQDIVFNARGSSNIPLNESGQVNFTGFTAISLVGVINELKAIVADGTLDDTYNNDAGAATIVVDAGDVTWDQTGAYSFIIELKNTTNPNGSDDGFTVQADTGEGKDFFSLFKASPDDIGLNAELEAVTVVANSAVSLSGNSTFALGFANVNLNSGALTLKGTASIETDAAQDLSLTPGAGGLTSITTGQKVATTTVNTATYDLLISDYILLVTYTSTGAVTSLTLPTAQTTDGREITIIDAGGNASINNIKVDTEGSELINGQPDAIINSNYGSLTFCTDGSNWFIK